VRQHTKEESTIVDFAFIGQRTGARLISLPIWMAFLESGEAVQRPSVIRGFSRTPESSSTVLRRP
jgi:hypothetical protein